MPVGTPATVASSGPKRSLTASQLPASLGDCNRVYPTRPRITAPNVPRAVRSNPLFRHSKPIAPGIAAHAPAAHFLRLYRKCPATNHRTRSSIIPAGHFPIKIWRIPPEANASVNTSRLIVTCLAAEPVDAAVPLMAADPAASDGSFCAVAKVTSQCQATHQFHLSQQLAPHRRGPDRAAPNTLNNEKMFTVF